MKQSFISILTLTAIVASSIVATAQQTSKPTEATTKPRTVTRLFWQDSDAGVIRWSNLQKGSEWSIHPADIAAFPKLDKEQCSFVQMVQAEGIVLTGVHDQEDGAVQSGWVAMDSGVEKESHGDHFHWQYTKEPGVKSSKLDANQGNPAHVYVYDNNFYLANDKKGGFTLVSPRALAAGKPTGFFYKGGGGHITLAAVGSSVYSTWIDRDGDNKGRVDVVPTISPSGNGYSFHLPSGGIHGATVNSGRIFFAPADGVCWVDADKYATKTDDSVVVHHLSLGKDDSDKPRRTGAFTNHMHWVLFVTGAGPTAQLCMIDAKSPKPSTVHMSLELAEGTTATTPVAVRTPAGKHYALVFQESQDRQQEEKLVIVQLDAKNDGDLSNAAVVKSIAVGASKIEGHSGHHEMTTTPSGRFAILTNPGDGTIWVIDLAALEVQAKLSVGGTPNRVIAVGG